MDCPKCESKSHVKQGYVGGRQRFKCKDCNFMYTVSHRGKSTKMKVDALKLYLEGMGFRGIGRFLGVSAVSVMNWIRKFGEEACKEPIKLGDSTIIELDELHTYIGSKKTIFGFGLRLTELQKRTLISRLAAEELRQEKSCIII